MSKVLQLLLTVDSEWKIERRVKAEMDVGQWVGTEARSGAHVQGLAAKPRLCLSFEKLLFLFLKAIYLGTSAQPAERKVGPRKWES